MLNTDKEATPHETASKALVKLQDGFAVAEELVGFICAQGTLIPDEAEARRDAWDRGAQGKRFKAALAVLPSEESIHYDIGYALRVLMCDVALAHLHRQNDIFREAAEHYRSGRTTPAINLALQIGIDTWNLEWDATQKTFTHMVLQEPVTQPAGLEYMLALRISIPEELRV
jgi:hypothetical protein